MLHLSSVSRFYGNSYSFGEFFCQPQTWAACSLLVALRAAPSSSYAIETSAAHLYIDLAGLHPSSSLDELDLEIHSQPSPESLSHSQPSFDSNSLKETLRIDQSMTSKHIYILSKTSIGYYGNGQEVWLVLYRLSHISYQSNYWSSSSSSDTVPFDRRPYFGLLPNVFPFLVTVAISSSWSHKGGWSPFQHSRWWTWAEEAFSTWP